MDPRIRGELAAITPHDPIEEEHLGKAVAWVESGAVLRRVSTPANPPKHLEAYFAVIDDGHILLVDHKNAHCWLPTGGHVEPGEDPRATVVRELKEELGLEVARDNVGPPRMISVTDTVGVTAGHTDVSLWYAIKGDRFARVAFDPAEFHDARWFAFSDVPLDRSDPFLGRFLAKLREEETRRCPK